jgi:hypothetical protein
MNDASLALPGGKASERAEGARAAVRFEEILWWEAKTDCEIW